MENSPQVDSAEFEDPLSDYESAEFADQLERALAEETVAAMTSQPFLQITSNTSIRQAIQTMFGAKAASVLVVEDERVVGIFTERDVLEKVSECYPKLASHPVSEVMTSDPTVVYEFDSAAAAVASIAVAGHRHVPVLGVDDRLVGVIGPRRVFEFVEKHFDS